MTEKRPYTMSPAALEQRQNAAKNSTGPITEAGKAASSRNAWKTGEHSVANKYWREKNIFAKTGKPCRTTCHKHPNNNPEHPCTLVQDGITQAGGDCVDKQEFLIAFDGLMAAMSTGEAAPVHGMMAGHLADGLSLMSQLREAINEEGVFMQQEKFDKDGKICGYNLLLNPAIEAYSKHMKAMGLNLSEALASPKSINTKTQKDDENETFASMFSGIADRMGKPARIINSTAQQVDDDDE